MLKINVIDSPKAVTFVVQGKLHDPWTSELNRVWRENRNSFERRIIVVDLKEMTAVDQSGLRLIAEMSAAGAKVVTAGVLTNYLLDTFLGNHHAGKKAKEKNNIAG